MLGIFLLLGTHLSLLPAHPQPSGAPVPTEALPDSSQRQQVEAGLRTAAAWASCLAGWAGRTSHQPLLIPPLTSLSGEQLQALSVGQRRKTVIGLLAATLSWSLRATLAVSPDKCPRREKRPSALSRGPSWKWLTFLRVRAGPPPCLPGLEFFPYQVLLV